MKSRYLLAIDQGTTGSTALVVGADGSRARPREPRVPAALPAARLGRARARGDSGQRSQVRSRGARSSATVDPTRLRRHRHHEPARDHACCGSAARGKPVHRAIVWQDRRTTRALRRAQARGPRAAVSRAHRPRARSLLLGHQARVVARPRADGARAAPRAASSPSAPSTASSSIASRAAVHATDVTNASRTLLFDIRKRWPGTTSCSRASARARARAARGDAARPSSSGTRKGFGPLPDGIPIAGIAGDQQAALFGQTCFEVGRRQVHLRHRAPSSW